MEKLVSKVWFLSFRFTPALRIIGLVTVLSAIALAAGAPGDWGGCGGCP